jgi:CubicO group peptidase (beta-lactamase class C family)
LAFGNQMSKLLQWLCLSIILAHTAAAEDRFDRADAYIADAIRRWEIPGLAIAVVKDGQVVFARGYGVCEIGTQRPVSKDTVFSIASCTKSFTSACVGILVDEGKLSWDDPVRKHLPAFELADAYVSEQATLRDLLCHRTGLVRGDLLFVKGDLSREEILRRTKFLGQAAPFRSKVTYNNVMYAQLGEVVAKTSGMSWEQFIKQRIFEPLAMKSAAVSREDVPIEKLATRHRRYDGKVEPLRTPIRDELCAPAGAIHASATDMAQWLKLHLQEGEWDGRRLLQAETVREMHSLHQSIPIQARPDANDYSPKIAGTGLGWFVRDFRGRKIVAHGGGWGADMVLVPEESLGVIVLSNVDHNLVVQMLACDMLDAYLVGPEQAWAQGGKWDIWMTIGGPGHMDRARTAQKAELDKARRPGTMPSVPLARFAGDYDSQLYGLLEVRYEGDQLRVRFGDHSAQLAHWENDSFYAPAVVEPFLDWLVKFQVESDMSVSGLEIVHIGWKDPDERHLFRRVGPGTGASARKPSR